MLKVNNNEEVKNMINENEIVILYFSNKACGACEAIRSKVERILKSYSKVKSIEIEGEKQIELAAINNVFSFPLLILFVNGKETIRVGRNINLFEFENIIKRYYKMLF